MTRRPISDFLWNYYQNQGITFTGGILLLEQRSSLQ